MSLMKKYISNWDTLTEEQQKKAEEQFKGNPGLNTAVVHPAAKFFEENRWVKIDKFVQADAKEFFNTIEFNRPSSDSWSDTCLGWKQKWRVCNPEWDQNKEGIDYITLLTSYPKQIRKIRLLFLMLALPIMCPHNF